jgi:DNA replication protein DnaC
METLDLSEILKKVKDSNLVQESPCKCGYSDSEFPYGCEGQDIIRKNGVWVRCDGFYSELRKKELQLFIDELPPNVRNKVVKPEIYKYQKDVIEKMRNNDKGVFLWGESDFGKTHLLYRLIYKMIENSVGVPPTWVIVKSLDLLDSWTAKYNSDLDRSGRLEVIRNKLNTAKIVMIDDLSQINSISESRSEEIFYLFDKLRDENKMLLISYQWSIEDFCLKIPSEAYEIKSGRGSRIQNRLHDLCLEIHAVKNTQMEL